MILTVHTDGGSRGNPGHSAIGIIFLDQWGSVVWEKGEYIGIATNNDAEYSALITAIDELKHFVPDNDVEEVRFNLDSNLVVQQVKGVWKIKEPRLREYVAKIRQQLTDLKVKWSINYVPREQNSLADLQVNQALDAQAE